MDMSGNDTNIEPPKVIGEIVNYNAQNMSSDWHITRNNTTNTSIGLISMGNNPIVESSSCSSMVEIFDQPFDGANWTPTAELRENMFLSTVVPPSLPHLPPDSGFIERAVRFSCFNGGHFSETVNPFSNLDHLNPNSRSGLMPKPDEASVEEVFLETKNGVDLLGTQTYEAEFSVRGDGTPGELCGKGVGLKKRRRTEQKTVNNETKEAQQSADKIKRKGDENPSGKGPDPPKEEYIHVRARRGEATNSHSLAERLRREKISERMKFLQDLVPGCSGVTGKAVMLDEIINYVQSLQRQVEFLSMKLATVNPRLDFNIEGFRGKDILQTRADLLASLDFPPDMTMPFPHTHPTLPAGVIQATLHGETLHRPICHQSNVVSRGCREPNSQAPGVWDDELHNVVHNGFDLSAPHNSSDLSGHAESEQ